MSMQKIEVSTDARQGGALAPAPSRPVAATPSRRDDFERMFDQIVARFWNGLPESRMNNLLEPGFSVLPAVEVSEKDNAFEITAELPGMDPAEMEISIQNGFLTISGEKTESKEEKDKNYHLSERQYGSFKRSFQLPETVDTERIEARFDKGVLIVSVPKTEKASQRKTIEVKTG